MPLANFRHESLSIPKGDGWRGPKPWSGTSKNPYPEPSSPFDVYILEDREILPLLTNQVPQINKEVTGISG